MFWTTRVIKLLIKLAADTAAILKILRLRQPGMMFIKIVSESNGMLNFVLNLPPASAVDVVSRELTVKIADADAVVVSLAGSEITSASMSGADNDPVVGQLVDIDDAGNRSPAKDFSFVLVDTIAPPQPGDIGLTVTDET